MKILFVDDSRDMKLLILKNFQKASKKRHLKIFFAHNGREALRCLEKNPDMDIVFTDIEMPLMDGMTLLRLTFHLFPSIPFVVLSAYDRSFYQEECDKLGVYGILEKPINFLEIEKILQDVSNRKNRRLLNGPTYGSSTTPTIARSG